MSSKICQICGKPSGIYPLCREHLQMKLEGRVVKNEETGRWELKDTSFTKVYGKCILCGDNSNGKPLCYDCYCDCRELEDDLDRNKPPYEMKDYYYNLKNANYRIVDIKNINRNCMVMIALANIIYDSYDDSSLISRVYDDVVVIKENYLNKRKKVQPTAFTEQSDSQKSSFIRTLDGHNVKSDGERIIDDILYTNYIVHCYEKDVVETPSLERTIKSDWLIPVLANKGIYVEYWGMNTKDYLKNKEEKRKMYKEYNIPLIEIEKDDVKEVSGLTTRIIREYNSLKEKIKNNI